MNQITIKAKEYNFSLWLGLVNKIWNTCYYCFKDNRRGVGFDKPELNNSSSDCKAQPSPTSFGHYGFTGTYAWADPENEMVIVFLSNRTYPTMNNKLLGIHNIRARVREVVYKALID